jgi:predicted RecA/RadA family phage recombinase
MKNFVQKGHSLPLVAPSGGVVAGNVYKIGSILAVAAITAAAGATFEGSVEGVFDITSDTGTAYAQGDVLYWDNTGMTVTKTSSGNTKIGYATEAKLSATTTARVKLWPMI